MSAANDVCQAVSPEFRLRPSLSGNSDGSGPSARRRVAGVQTPAFVERWTPCGGSSRAGGVAGVQTPAFVERGLVRMSIWWPRLGVAGVHTPAFVERGQGGLPAVDVPDSDGVAGVQTPAFVERFRASTFDASMHRPRVAGVHTPAFVERFSGRTSPTSRRGRVAGVHTPAFVECTRITIPLAFSTWCRRSADSGLAALGGDSAQSHMRATSSRASAPMAVV